MRAARALGPLRSESFSAAGADRSRPGDAVGAIVKSAGKKKKKENTCAEDTTTPISVMGVEEAEEEAEEEQYAVALDATDLN